MSRKIRGWKRISKNILHAKMKFFPKMLDSENRIIYNTDIDEFLVEKFISFGSGVV